jgi:crossover junction endodeoxyribonuclease RusA
MAEEINIVLPLPPRVLSPNARTHWAVKSRATKALRCMAYLEVRKVCLGQSKGWTTADCKVTWHAKTRRRMDRDNCLAMLKAAFDGLVDGGLLVDDCGLTHLPLELKHDPHSPRVELSIRRTDGKA